MMDTRVHYAFKDGEIIEIHDFLEWAKWFERSATDPLYSRTIARIARGDVFISTVFLSLDHSFDDGPPVLFETLVTVDGEEEDMLRYITLEEAKIGHGECIEKYILNQPEGQIQIWTNYISRKRAELAVSL